LLENTKITSPIAGTVVRVNTKVGRFADKIEDDKPMFIIENLDVLEMKIKVSEYSIGKIQVGQEASIRADILGGETVTGEVTDISPTGEEKGGGSTERVIPTTIRIAEKNTKLIAGITAKAQIALNESRDTLIVPISSLLQKEDGLYLASVQNNMIKLIPVEHGVQNDIQTEVLAIEGSVIEEGTQVVISPTENLTDGLLVVVKPAM
ncbi:MAG: HlyD family efflux transporter periplasmic adaptor subunit, partial [Clostridium sp.]